MEIKIGERPYVNPDLRGSGVYVDNRKGIDPFEIDVAGVSEIVNVGKRGNWSTATRCCFGNSSWEFDVDACCWGKSAPADETFAGIGGGA